VGVTVMCEDLPDERNTVTLDHAHSDSSGLPGAAMSYSVDPASRAALDHGLERAGEILREAGAREVHSVPLREAAGFHLMGTARMGEDPDRSVVDPLGACHDIPNLHIIDGSVFVTSAAVNPTPTIQAIALYIADQMKQRLATLFD
jgi:choline dehydrogenase-like flavoprotein